MQKFIPAIWFLNIVQKCKCELARRGKLCLSHRFGKHVFFFFKYLVSKQYTKSPARPRRKGKYNRPSDSKSRSFFLPSYEHEPTGHVEPLRGLKESSHCHPLAETDNNVRCPVLIQIQKDPLESRLLGRREDRILASNADPAPFSELSKSLDPALSVIFYDFTTRQVTRNRMGKKI